MTKESYVGEREQIITFLLQQCDAKNKQIEQQQKLNAELQQRLAKYEAPAEPKPE